MKVFQTVHDIQKCLLEINDKHGKTFGFVPTMGALHQGHLSLIQSSKEKTDITVASIFVNPTQFNDQKDFEKYPIQIDKDLEMLLDAGCDIVLVPSVEEVYPYGTVEKTGVNLGFLGKTLEAEHRKGHYEGVLQVVKRLLDIVQPDFLFLGQKDYQQCLVLSKLIEHYHLPIQLEICPTLREKDGLAMSSRNMRLTAEERTMALQLSASLFYIKEHINDFPIKTLIETELEKLNQYDLIKTEYLEIVNGKTLKKIKHFNPKIPTVALIAAKVGEIRLIDNVIIT
ncbi:MAG: pantoate--beta-alanine ligase [Chitinophagales bacterium]|nr:pantoate--beta-alanine ligase [Bacteroidota bacterium]